MSDPSAPPAPTRQLTLFDSTCLIVGIIVGAGVYQMAPDIAKGGATWWGALGLWVLGGLLSLCGAAGYAELGAAYPHAGGDYVYLSRAYGKWAGFLFGWLQLAIVRPGDIVVMAFAFATYARTIYEPHLGASWFTPQQAYAAAAVIALTAVNVAGVRQGKWTQNLLTTVKALGMVAIAVVALAAPVGMGEAVEIEPLPTSVALILVLFCFGGWNEVAYVAAELKDPGRNVLRALVAGIAATTLLYVALNGAFLFSLGYQGVAGSEAVAVDAMSGAFPEIGGRLIAALVCISALGAVSGLVFTGARISYAVGADHRLFRGLGSWSARAEAPVRALLVQAAIAVALIALLDDFVETILYTAPAVYSFYLATTLAVIVLRRRDPAAPRPYRVTAYPLPTLLFAAVCGYLIFSSVSYAANVLGKLWIVLIPAGVMVVGLVLYLATSATAAEPRDVGAS